MGIFHITQAARKITYNDYTFLLSPGRLASGLMIKIITISATGATIDRSHNSQITRVLL
ncbi:hypothetical protein ES15_0390 [Cronobacter sakazakii ES15]|uniref:Uncharacterized protein n=1 Tax=Cronobacter sakazakii (strain ATCC BAA-894) TaxID=290339 RepID=A7MPC1_CROS8|nr:hypothetical protein ESA_00068 [Cronobacter sakazakii ATCC BAA-894]AFJ97963.1 hypothetical protein ES15_0390 [Cronobacter sakazakii ES15]